MVFFTASVLAVSLEFQLDKYIAVRLKSEFSAQLFHWNISGLQMFSLIMAINTVLVALIAIPFSKWMARLQSSSIMTVGMCLYTAGFAVLAFSNWALLLIGSAVLLTLGELMYSPVRQVLLAGMIPDSDRAAYMAADGMSYNVAALLCGANDRSSAAFICHGQPVCHHRGLCSCIFPPITQAVSRTERVPAMCRRLISSSPLGNLSSFVTELIMKPIKPIGSNTQRTCFIAKI